jgi:hypothetical protein
MNHPFMALRVSTIDTSTISARPDGRFGIVDPEKAI